MSYLEQKEAPKREDRLRACIACGGPFDGVVKRMRCCQPDGNRAFSQNGICLLLPALGIMNTVPNSVVLMHGAVGCGSSAHGGNAGVRAGSLQRWGAAKDGTWLSTALNEHDVIAGGEEKLAAAIRQVDERLKPAVIFVVAGCVPGIIGDDIDGMTDRLQPEVAAKLLPVHCEGFKTKIWATSYDAVYHAIGRILLGDGAEPATADDSGRPIINLMNVGSMGRVDEVELERLLTALGFDINFYPVFAKPENFRRMSRAALSVSTCPTHDDYLLEHLREKFGVPYVIRHMPIGIGNTADWLRSIAGPLGRSEQAEELINAEKAELQAALAEFRPAFAGRKAFVSAGEFRALATAKLLAELGFDVVAVRPYHHDKYADGEYDKLAALGGGSFMLNIANCQPFEEANLIRKLKPDVFLGHMNCNSTAAKEGVATAVIYNTGLQYLGYQGAYQLARRLHRQLANPSFNRNLSRWLGSPYKAGWFGQDPFAYIKTPGGEL